jgi:aconitate hydratase 2 / 2-methylisocitrate dehydratase
MLAAYRTHTAEHVAVGIPPLPLDASPIQELCDLLQQPPAGEADNLLALRLGIT